MSRKILVTGGTGFLGAALIRRLCALPGTTVVAPLRSLHDQLPELVVQTSISDIDGATDWSSSLCGVDTVVHAAARVHVMHEDDAAQSLDKFRTVNVAGTLRLARQALAAGVKRLIFISSVKVNGESTRNGQPFTADDLPHPVDAYGISKYEAEQQLLELAKSGSMEVVIIRPVLIYGPGVGANFYTMLRWISKGLPLPFGAVNNKRSLVSLNNVVDFVAICIDHPAAANQVFLVSDGHDVSTTELMRHLIGHLGARTYLLPVPVAVMEAAASWFGKRAVAQRLFGSLHVDISKNKDVLGWQPPQTLDDGLKLTVKHYRESCKK